MNYNKKVQYLEQVENLIHSITHKYSVPNYTKEDLFQECMTKLWIVLDDYDNQYSLTTYVYTVLTNLLYTLAVKESNTINMNHVKVNGIDNILKETKQYDLTRYCEDIPYSNKELDMLFTAFVFLHDEDNKEIIERWLRGETMGIIGYDLGISEQAVSKRINKFTEKVRDEVGL